MYICLYVYIYILYICIYVYMYICIYVYMYICIHVCMYEYMYIYICIYVYMYVYIYICIHVCIYIYVSCVYIKNMYLCIYHYLNPFQTDRARVVFAFGGAGRGVFVSRTKHHLFCTTRSAFVYSHLFLVFSCMFWYGRGILFKCFSVVDGFSQFGNSQNL